jgi:D-lyxose ketol-isomerase
MKRSQINQAIKDATLCFQTGLWALPPTPRWDVTDCGLGQFEKVGLVLVNLAEEPEYCEKVMFSKHHQVTPMHTHRKKIEDIICRRGQLAIELWKGHPERTTKGESFQISRNGRKVEVRSGESLLLLAGERVTIFTMHSGRKARRPSLAKCRPPTTTPMTIFLLMHGSGDFQGLKRTSRPQCV